MRKIELICTTLGKREEEFKRLLNSLSLQEKDNLQIRLIIVNQGDDTNIMKLIKNYSQLDITYLKDEPKGSSHGRNIGFQFAKGDFIGFPDDDCWYPPGFFKSIIDEFSVTHADVILTSVYDPVSGKKYRSGKSASIPGWFEINEVYSQLCVSMFFKREILEKINAKYGTVFNEKLAAGRFFGGGEETDLLIKVFYENAKIWVNPNLVVYHRVGADFREVSKARSGGRGLGALMKEYGSKIPTIREQYFSILIKSIVGCIVRGIRYKGAFKYYLERFIGLLEGYYKWNKGDC